MKIFRKPSLLGVLALSAAAITSALLVTSCDNPSTTEELLLQAKIKMDAGDCGSAVQLLAPITESNDEVYNTLGWAYLCRSGAPFYKLGDTVLKYQESQGGNLTIIGDLANALLPLPSTSLTDVGLAVTTFGKMTAGKKQKFSVAIADIASAAVILANAASGSSVKRTDVSGGSCYGADCTNVGTVAANCPANRMSDQNATDFANAFSNANTALNNDTSFGDFYKLIQQLVGKTGSSAATRCYIVNNMLRQ